MQDFFLKKALVWMLARLKEPSTWAGIAVLIATQLGIENQTAQQMTTWLAGGAGVLAIILNEKGVL